MKVKKPIMQGMMVTMMNDVTIEAHAAPQFLNNWRSVFSSQPVVYLLQIPAFEFLPDS